MLEPDRGAGAERRGGGANTIRRIYWYSMLKIPDKSEFPGTGPSGNGIPTHVKSQGQWLAGIKTDGCITCHQLGNKATRTIPEALGQFELVL